MTARAQSLIERIPRDTPREFHLLVANCESQLNTALDQLNKLAEDPRLQMPQLQPERLRLFRRVVTDLDFLEQFGLSALERRIEGDTHLNRIVNEVRREISFPLLPPVVVPLSQGYFHIYPPLNLLLVPPLEGQFLLHLPDLYHELAHLLLLGSDPRLSRFSDSAMSALDVALDYLSGLRDQELGGRGPGEFLLYLYTWERAWIKSWTAEFFCDLFAILTLGPAFAWAHLHLCAKRGRNPFHVPLLVPDSHPADHARMTAMLFGLKLTGFSEQAEEIGQRWGALIAISGGKREPEYRQCFPEHVLEAIAQKAYQGVIEIKCRIATPATRGVLHDLLNGAWKAFWKDPLHYTEWEQLSVAELKQGYQ